MTCTPRALASRIRATEPLVLTWQMWMGAPMEAAAAISRAVPQSSAAAGMPGTPKCWETFPLVHQPTRSKVQVLAVGSDPPFPAWAPVPRLPASAGYSPPGGRQSLRAIAPASRKAAKSVSSSPCRSLVTQAAVYTWASAVFARSNKASTVSGESIAGLVLGIASKLVTPPAAAARQPVYTSSLWVSPGSRRWTCSPPSQELQPAQWHRSLWPLPLGGLGRSRQLCHPPTEGWPLHPAPGRGR